MIYKTSLVDQTPDHLTYHAKEDSYHWIGPQYYKPMKMSRQKFDVEVWNPYYKKLHPQSNPSSTPKPKPDDLWIRDENGHITGMKNWNP
jgi:hypothetical protein